MDYETRDKMGPLIKCLENVKSLLFVMECAMMRDIYTTRDLAPAVEGICGCLSTQVEELHRICREAEDAAECTAEGTMAREAG